MSLTLFPARASIGTARLPDGRSFDVLMTPEFSRALSDMLERIGGPTGVSTTELTRMIKELQAQAATLIGQVKELFDVAQSLADALADQELAQAMTTEERSAENDAGEKAMLALLGSPVGDNYADTLADLLTLAMVSEQHALPQKNIVTGSRGGNVALASLLTALAKSGIITDSTT